MTVVPYLRERGSGANVVWKINRASSPTRLFCSDWQHVEQVCVVDTFTPFPLFWPFPPFFVFKNTFCTPAQQKLHLKFWKLKSSRLSAWHMYANVTHMPSNIVLNYWWGGCRPVPEEKMHHLNKHRSNGKGTHLSSGFTHHFHWKCMLLVIQKGDILYQNVHKEAAP